MVIIIINKRCGHCKKLNPIYTEVADELKAQGSEGKNINNF